MKYVQWLILSLLFFGSIFTPFDQTAQAEELPGKKIVAVQARKYNLRHEFSLLGGLLPLDAYAKGLTLGASYTFHFNQFFAWETLNFHLSKNLDTGLKQDLQNNFGASPTQFNLVKYMMTSGIVVKPIYRKMIIFNRAVVHGETSFILGGGATKFDQDYRTTVVPGVILRAWLNKAWSIRIDVRDYITLDGFSMKNVLFLGAGLSLNYPWS
jgi:outer membrane beta-barrel protein